MKTLRLITMTFAAFAAQATLAHTELTGTVPADHAMIAAAPEKVQLKFSEPVRLTALSIQRDGAQKQSLGPLTAESSEMITVALPAIEDGHYVVAWRALSEDTHVMSGEFMFAVGAANSHDAHMNHEAAADEEHHDDHGGAH